MLSAISEGMQSTASRRPAKRKAFQRMRLKVSRMTLKKLTDKFVAKVDAAVDAKCKEILTV